MMMTMLRFYQAMVPISPLILRGLNCRRTMIHQEPLIVPPKLKCLLGESAREDQNQLVVRRRARRSRWNITSPGSPAGHFPAAASASMPPTIGNDDDVTKILPSNATNQSTDTEEVEGSLNPDSSGAIGTPPELKVVRTVGGKCKGGTRNKKRSKKTGTKYNNNCCGGARMYHTPLGNGEERRGMLETGFVECWTK